MKKIPTLFQRDPANMKRVRNVVVMGCEWVAEGEGIATRKYNGACCAIIEGKFYKRREVKSGTEAPEGFVEIELDKVTGKRVGWIPVGRGPEDKYFRDAFMTLLSSAGTESNRKDTLALPRDTEGTYELVGPAINKNPECFAEHTLLPHAHAQTLPDAPRTFEELQAFLEDFPYEGIVWHHPDGRMAKIKRRDFY